MTLRGKTKQITDFSNFSIRSLQQVFGFFKLLVQNIFRNRLPDFFFKADGKASPVYVYE